MTTVAPPQNVAEVIHRKKAAQNGLHLGGTYFIFGERWLLHGVSQTINLLALKGVFTGREDNLNWDLDQACEACKAGALVKVT